MRFLHSASFKKIVVLLALGIFMALVALLIPQEYPVPGARDTLVSRAIGAQHFDFVEWLSDAWGEKAGQLAVPIQDFMTDEQRSQFVLEYMAQVRQWWQLEWQVRQIYNDPTRTDPASATEQLRAQREAIRAMIERRRPTVEAILQQQVSSVLVSEGFGVGGEIFPPVAARITPLPNILILSPRDEIQREDGEPLQAGLTVDQMGQIESQVQSATNQSALVTPIGGLAAYPTMIVETTDLTWLLQTISHEWTHNWLYLRPLGYSYLADSQVVRTINETVASLSGDELGLKVMRRYYLETLKNEHPDLVEPQPLQIPDDSTDSTPPTKDPNAFSFNHTLYETRVKVDDLLSQARALEADGQQTEAEAKITGAENYMEQQRQVINSHGYYIRKLNQAYFAFYGAYADQPGGAAGRDPTGPNVIALRVYSPSLHAFLDRVSRVLSLEDLQRAVAASKPN
jgi:hypothetical protein